MDVTHFLEHAGQLFIGGEWVDPVCTTSFTVLNSATEEQFETVAEADERDIDRAVMSAREAFDRGPWARMSHAERAQYVLAMADEIDKIQVANACTWTVETGVLYQNAKGMASGLGDLFRSYAAFAGTYPFQTTTVPKQGGSVAFVIREPVGVVGAIIPWNGAPFLIANKVAPALLAGCTIVVKSSPEAPGSGHLLAEVGRKVGLPPGVINFVTADRQASEHLVRNPGVDKITFTGSTAAGRRIAALCAERIARCTLELGGKSPAIIFDDYDLETAANAIASRSILQTGQVCWSIARVIVSRHRHDALVDALSANFQKVRVGDPFDSEVNMGPLAMGRQRDRVEAFIQKGKAEGAVLATGGQRPPHLGRGYFIEPTVFGNVDNQSTIGREEVFGPVLAVVPVKDTDEALAVANDTIFGLNAAIFTHDVGKAFAVARNIRAGTVGHNGVRRELSLPFGGFKQSGFGREGGAEGLQEYLETKVVILDGVPGKEN
jgi:aldehyde dehydrogenase (NAD+)